MRNWMKRGACLLCVLVLGLSLLPGCGGNKQVRIGVSMGVGPAERWDKEKAFMEAKAAEMGLEIEVRLNRSDEPQTYKEDCIEMIDSGIDVLILTPRDVNDVADVMAYAKEKKVPVISYARAAQSEDITLFVGYDNSRIGQRQGQYLSELVFSGDYILLRGDPNDSNAGLLYEGAMRYIEPLGDSINILLDAPVPGWSPEEAKTLVLDAVKANGNQVDAILAPNDKIAGACAEALAELGVTQPVVITGMDAELSAAQRIAQGTQDITFYMALKELADTAVIEAHNLATGKETGANAELPLDAGGFVSANLLTGELVTKENLNRVLIDGGVYAHEDVYGAAA